MSLATNIQDLTTRIATEIKGLRTLINGNAADLTGLTTTAKGNLVAAINELQTAVQDAANSGGAAINDTATTTTSVWSSNKTNTEIQNRVASIIDSAPGTLDTLNEIAAALGDDPSFATTITTALGNRVRFDAAQTLDATQQTQARANIGAAAGTHTHTTANISDSSTVGRSVLTAADGAAARTAIGAGTSNLVIGTTATTAKAGNYTPPAATETATGLIEIATTLETTTGTDAVRAVTPAGLKAVADTKAAATHTHTVANLSDSTAIGRTVITAADAAAVRTAIGAGTSSLVIGTTAGTAKAGDYSPPAATETAAGIVELATVTEATGGTDTTRAITAAGLKAVTDGKASATHTHVATDISDSTTVGRSVLTSATAAAARTAIGAGTSNLAIGTNAGTAADAAAVGDTTANFVATFEAGLV